MKLYILLILWISFLSLSCTRRSKIIDIIGFEPVEYDEKNSMRHERVTVLYSKATLGQNLFGFICEKVKNEYTADKGFRIGELYSPLTASRLFYAKESTSLRFLKNIGPPLSLFQIESNDQLKIIMVYEFENHVGIHIASGS